MVLWHNTRCNPLPSHTLIGRAEGPLAALKVKTVNSQVVHLTCPEGPAGDISLDIEVRTPAFPNSLDGKYRCTKILVRAQCVCVTVRVRV